MSSFLVIANSDDIILISVVFIALLQFPYLTPKTKLFTTFQLLAFKPINDIKL